VDEASWKAGWPAARPSAALAGQKFKGDAGSLAIVPDGEGWYAVAGVAGAGGYKLVPGQGREALPGYLFVAADCARRALIGWALGQYRFERYRKALGRPAHADARGKAIAPALAEAAAVALVRDLVNTPTEDLGPLKPRPSGWPRRTAPRCA
jgi:leucyl aminopeptidase